MLERKARRRGAGELVVVGAGLVVGPLGSVRNSARICVPDQAVT